VGRHIEGMAVGGGYVCGSSHDISQAVPIQNFYAMRDAVINYRFHKSEAPHARRREGHGPHEEPPT